MIHSNIATEHLKCFYVTVTNPLQPLDIVHAAAAAETVTGEE
jgi:hypothetical protein